MLSSDGLTDSKFILGKLGSSSVLSSALISGDCDLWGDSGAVSESSSALMPWAWLWWYLSPFACLYFLLQSCSGHSSNTGDIAQGEATLLGFFDADAWATIAAGFVAAWFPLNGGLSSLDFLLFSGLGTEKVVGDVEGVFVIAELDMLILVDEEFLDALPFDPPFRNLLWTYINIIVMEKK
jgi:hypothetical protein